MVESTFNKLKKDFEIKSKKEKQKPQYKIRELNNIGNYKINSTTKLKDYEIKAIRVFTLTMFNHGTGHGARGLFKFRNKNDIIAETIVLFYKKRERVPFKSYEHTIKWLTTALTFGEHKWQNQLGGSPFRIEARYKWTKNFISELENPNVLDKRYTTEEERD